ncbi:MAG: N-carbamoylputrescine amidase, partial [Sphingomonadales bacterium]
MTRTITVAALQLSLPGPVAPNIDAVTALVEEAAAKGA